MKCGYCWTRTSSSPFLNRTRARDEPWTEQPVYVSIATIWEIVIKVRQNKLLIPAPVADLEGRLLHLGCGIVPITGRHAVADVDPWPDTNDPFDRLLLAVCQIEGLRLVTRDRKLVGHPLAWRPAAA